MTAFDSGEILRLLFVPFCHIFKNVKKLLPGHYLKFDMEQFNFKLIEYWDLEERNYEEKSYQENLKRVKTLVEDSIRRRLVSDVPLGIFLSGGIDSSIITAVMKKFNDRDFTAIKRFRLAGIQVCFLSGDSVVNELMAKKRGIDFYKSKTWNNGSNKVRL